MAAASTPPLDRDFVAQDFLLKSVDGSSRRLSDFCGGTALLVMFICNHCPYVKSILTRLVAHVSELMNSYGVKAVAIMPNDTEVYKEDSFANMIEFARQHKFPFQYLIDESQNVARGYGAVCTPDFFCFDSNLRLRYRGRFDPLTDSENEDKDKTSELFEAVKMIATTGEGPEIQRPSIGCSVKWRCVDSV
ncbi:MAG: thioredoxin family protein [Aaplasma endosymbiont of Hyalomma asiaticum]